MVAHLIPEWQLTMCRKSVRIPFVTPVQVYVDRKLVFARSTNLSAGGMSLECRHAFDPGDNLLLSFSFPNGLTFESFAKVVHCRPGERAGIEFIGLGPADLRLIGEFVRITDQHTRRSIRIPERIAVTLIMLNGCHTIAETILISRHGCSVQCRARLTRDDRVIVWIPERRMAAPARVVSMHVNTEEVANLGLEFIGKQNFWEIAFHH
jgi:hypothetical protein